MTSKSSGTGKPSADTLKTAKFLYKRLSRGLKTLVERLEGGLEANDTAATKAQLQGHFKLLQQILDMEIALGKREGHTGSGATALDLDAARREIRDRLLKRAGAKSTDESA